MVAIQSEEGHIKSHAREEALVQASTWQHVPSGDIRVVVWLWSFRFELPHLPLQHFPPRVTLDCPLGMNGVEEKPGFLCVHLLTARYPTGFLASESLERCDLSSGGCHLLVIAAGTLALQAPLKKDFIFMHVPATPAYN